jgi:wobble nucleotide-excising tRNase
MLRKLISIKNVGRFLNYGAGGDVELKRYTLVFAENGRGKTTLCAILRSLQSGDSAHVLGRTTLGTSGAPEITILLDGGTAAFKMGSWNTTVPSLAIFDSTFVSENVFSGDAVDLRHKRNFYGVIVGKQGVDHARKIEIIDAASREKSTEIRELREAVQALVPQGVTVEDFLPLQEDTTIDSKITEKEKEHEAVKQADRIKNRAAFVELSLPTFPSGFAGLLDKTIAGVAEDAARHIAIQIEAHSMHERGEPWLSEGMGYVRNNTCPFCGRPLDGVALIAAYKAYFSEAYSALRTEITSLRKLIDDAFSDRELARIERTLDQNTAAFEFWTNYCMITPPALADSDKVVDALSALRQEALALIDKKAASPLDRVAADELFAAAHATLMAIQDDSVTYNQAVQEANAAVAAKKGATEAADIRTVESALSRLRATKKRYEPNAITTCQVYKAAVAAKKNIEDQKAIVKEHLDKYTLEAIGSYEQAINRLLNDFQAGFQITETKHGYPGGIASSSYQILINETSIELGDSSTPLDRPSFKNTLSSGDKSTLALAFFLAQLEHDPEAASKIVVFDDPFNSQDNFRKMCTVQKIKKCGESCGQVIVLSHDQYFLKYIWNQLAPQAADRKCLKLARIGIRDTKISEWDIEQATQAPFLSGRKALVDYYQTGAGIHGDIVNKIRPVLETYIKSLYPEDFAADALGTIIGKIRTAGGGHQLFPLLDDLELLNEYTRRYHHGENTNAPTEPINETELQGLVKKTLAITGGC